ncbi:MAG: SusC/RagA family TonB-linked outer membrane protein [Bacteroidales bacterium]|nr:SusC/RagA family TonB-linked outer membrane protein [Bacteroidales bacterium]MBP9977899.1 SusC/RagA family TonB-linked outer membrane protein [Bacteroidales bacterium]
MKRLLLLISILFIMTESDIIAQQRFSVSGTVVDSKNAPLIGVAVIEKGTLNGTETNLDGKFSINVSSQNSILVFTYMGFITREVQANQSAIIQMEEDTRFLSEIVVIGYGQVRKEDATGSIVAIKPETLNRGAVTAPQELLIGKVAGLQITPGDGSPGSGAQIRIRGGASLRASNDPLIVIDGVPTSNDASPGMKNGLASINPSDIETFTVLKDASATAIYGARASNGVIIITTKKGTKRFQVNYNSTYSVNQNIRTINSLNATDFSSKLLQAFPLNTTAGATARSLMGTYDTDWQKEIYQLGLSTDQSLSLSGTLASIPYRVSLGYNNQKGTLKTSSYERLTAGVNLTPSLFDDHLKVTANIKAVLNNNVYADGGAVGAAAFYDPTQAVYNYKNDKSIDYNIFNGFRNWGTAQLPNTLSGTNPLSLLYDKYDSGRSNRLIGNLELDYKMHFLPDLRAHINLGFDYGEGKGTNGVRQNSFQAWKDADFKGIGRKTEWNNKRQNTVLDFYLNYSKEIESIDSKIDVMGGYSWQHFYSKDYSKEISNHDTNPVVKKETTYPTESYLVSFYGRLNYTFKDRYLLTLTLRDDASSRFSPSTRWGLFPSAAFAWQINKESFLANSKTISDMKLRISYGVTGQQDLGLNDYPYIALYNQSTVYSNYMFGTNFYSLLKPTGYDENIKWEETASYNIGLDFGFLKNRITASVDAYMKKTDDLLNEIDVAAGTNFANRIVTNVGNLENKGIELNINAIPVDNPNFVWEIGLNGTWNETKITKLTANNNPDYVGIPTGGVSSGTGGTIQMHSVGRAPNTFYTYKQVYDVNGNPIQNLVVDLNKDGQITEADRYLTDYSPAPKYYFGFSNMFTIRNFDLGFNLRANLGNYMFNDFAAGNSTTYNFSNQGFLTNMVDVVNRTGFTRSNSPQQIKSDYFIEDASFIKMDNITLGYNFNKIFKSSIAGRLAFSVQNVFVITNYTGLDPEGWGIDNNIWPRPRIYTLGLNLTF